MPQQESLTTQQVQHVAALAHLSLDDATIEHIRSDLSSILSYVDLLAQADVEGVEPMASLHGHSSRLHSDDPEPSLDRDTILAAAPATEGPCISVPKVLDGGGSA